MFKTEDYPAKAGAQTCSKSKASKYLHRGTVYSTRPPNVPLIKWKLPPKVLLNSFLNCKLFMLCFSLTSSTTILFAAKTNSLFSMTTCLLQVVKRAQKRVLKI